MADLFSRWKDGLSRTSKVAFGRLAGMFGVTEITDDVWDELEALLIQADLGMETTEKVIADLQEGVQNRGLTRTSELRSLLAEELRSRLDTPPAVDLSASPTVVLLVGVNGSGKTTTAAKLGRRFTNEGKKTLLVAADTFRAAAVDQLQEWAGRLHTRYNLMEELKKVHRVAGKALPGAPHAVWLVLDATTGQNALNQAKAFKEAVGVTGVILAKLDSSARGGMAFAIQKELGLPILYGGLGEGPDDLTVFNPDAFVKGILG